MESNIDLEVDFRFLSLTVDQAEDFSLCFDVVSLGNHFKTGNKVGIVALQSDKLDAIANFMKKHNVAAEDTDILLSFITSYKSRILDIPTYVAFAAVELKSKITLSYTINS